MPESEIDKPVADMLDWVGLSHRAEARPATLSGGEQQRVAIARAVIARPEVLVADEPTGNVDPDMALKLLRLFEALNRLGTTIVVATHTPVLLAACRHIVGLEKGVIQPISHMGTNVPVMTGTALAFRNLGEDRVALTWVGRGDFAAEEWDDALTAARDRRTGPTADYLLGVPLLGDLLEEGFTALGYSCEDYELPI